MGRRAGWGHPPDARPQGPLRVVCVPGRHEAQEAGCVPPLTRAPYPHTARAGTCPVAAHPSTKALLSPGLQDGTGEGHVASVATSVLGMRGDKGNGNPLPISSRAPQRGGGGFPWEQPSLEYRSSLKNGPKSSVPQSEGPQTGRG